MAEKRKSLIQLFIPICIETLFYMLAGMVDTLMLSSVSDEAVGAVGTANTYIGMFIVMFTIVTSGMMAVMTQNIGAGRPGVAYQAKNLGVIFNSVLGILISVVLFLFSDMILDVIGIAKNLRADASIYLKIVGGFSFLNALIPIFSGYLRAFGHTKHSLIATIIGNVVNLILNAVFLFVFDMGVKGVAIATVVSKIVNLVIVFVISHFLVKAHKDENRLPVKQILKQIIFIGLPSALETIIYNFAMTIIIKFLNQMDPDGFNVTARSYTAQITNFSLTAGAALAQANAIMTGWRIGAGEYDECEKGTRKAAIIGIIVAVVLEGIFALTAGWIMKLLTDDPEMIRIVQILLTIDIVLEIGRITNLVYGNALKTSGDAIFPVVIATIFMYLCAVGGTYLFGIRLGLLAVGAYIGLTLDECIRAVAMFLRWKSGKWRSKSLVK